MKNKVKNKILASALIAAMTVISVAGCGGKKEDTKDPELKAEVVKPSNESEESEAGAGEEQSTEAATEAAEQKDVVAEIPPLTSDQPFQDLKSVYMVGDTCYEIYNYVEAVAADYAKTVNQLSKSLEGTAKVYDVIAPTSMGVIFPDNLKDQSKSSDMEESLNKITSMIEKPAVVVNAFSTLMQHRTDYIFFRTDHHWTSLGAYYAYADFCREAGIKAHELSEYELREYAGFLGSFYNDANKPENLANNPDTVQVYVPVTYASASMEVTDKKNKTFSWPILADVNNTSTGNKYGTFIAGDNPYTVIRNSAVTDGSSCVVVKESFGNAFVPYLLDHYQNVYVIDYRYWSGNLVNFVKENGVKDVILCNNISMIRNKSLVSNLAAVVF